MRYLFFIFLYLLPSCMPAPVPEVLDVSAAKFEVLLEEKEVFVLELWSDACGPCLQMEPVVASFAQLHPEVPIYRLDVLEYPAVPERYGMVVTPTFLFFREGRLVDSRFGTASVPDLSEWLKTL